VVRRRYKQELSPDLSISTEWIGPESVSIGGLFKLVEGPILAQPYPSLHRKSGVWSSVVRRRVGAPTPEPQGAITGIVNRLTQRVGSNQALVIDALRTDLTTSMAGYHYDTLGVCPIQGAGRGGGGSTFNCGCR